MTPSPPDGQGPQRPQRRKGGGRKNGPTPPAGEFDLLLNSELLEHVRMMRQAAILDGEGRARLARLLDEARLRGLRA